MGGRKEKRSKLHHDKVTKAKKEGQTTLQKKAIGSAANYVAFNWLLILNSAAEGKDKDKLEDLDRKALEKLTFANKQLNNIEMMDQLFSHAQTWITKDDKKAYLRYKMTPLFAELENWMTL